MAQTTGLTDAVSSRPGGRSARIRRNVLDATTAALLENGYSALSVGEVAASARTSEATIYRRWGNLTNLVADAVREFFLVENPIPDTGTLEGDLRQLLGSIVALIERADVQRLFRAVISLHSDNDAVIAARRAFWRDRFDRGATIIRRAIERGEVASDVDPDEIIETLVGATYARTLLTERATSGQMIGRSVNAALSLCRPND